MASSREPLWSSCFGNLFEHYDSALFGFLSPFLAPLIFPEQDALTALILTYAIIPCGMLARPLGSLVFGYIGDTNSRKKALFLTFAGMAIVSMIIGLSPTFEQAGIWAALLFCLGRILQNFFAAGESMGGAIYLLENSPEKRHDLLSGLYNASTIGGILMASFGVFALSYTGCIDKGWRFLYLGGGVMTLMACLFRFGTGGHSAPLTKTSYDIRQVLWEHKKALLLLMLIAGTSYANYAMALILPNGFIPFITEMNADRMSSLNTLLLLLDFATLPLFGWLSSKIAREKLMIAAALGIAVSAIPLFTALQGASLASIALIRVLFVLLGVAFAAPFHAWAQQLIPPAHRYIIISLGSALGSQLVGSPTMALSLWFYKKTGLVWSVGLYWALMAATCATILALEMSRKKATVSQQLQAG